MFENVDGQTTDAGVTGILLAHLGAFGSGELKISIKKCRLLRSSAANNCPALLTN